MTGRLKKPAFSKAGFCYLNSLNIFYYPISFFSNSRKRIKKKQKIFKKSVDNKIFF